MISLKAVRVALGALLTFTLGIPTSDSTVNLGYAQYQGVLNASEGITSFIGIRYADPPTGTLFAFAFYLLL